MKKISCIRTMVVALIATATSAFVSCGQSDMQNAQKGTMTDSLITAAFSATDHERVIALVDSLEQTGDVSAIRASYLRGISYEGLNNFPLAKDNLSAVIDMNPTNAQDSAYYLYATSALAEVLSFTTDYEGVLRVALPVIEQLKDQNAGYSSTLGDLMINVGFAQMSLRMKEDAAESFDGFYDIAMKNYAAKPSWQNLSFYFTSAFNIFQEYVRLEDFETAKKWLAREDSLIAIIIEREDIPAMPKDQLMSYYYISQGFMAVGLKQATELARAIADYQKTDFSKTVGGRISEASLLFEAERYGEAADDLAVLDQYLAEREMELSLDNISNFYGYKFKANNNAGRRESALTVASFIVEHLDSAIAKEKRSQTAELATIYETQQKDAEIAKQQISLSRQRWISTLAALVLLTTFFIIYTWYRRRAQKRLSVAHEQLKTAYDQLEETTAAKERIESELRIARDIQMSMVPNNFPEHERLDMYAEMNPAKEVGGDLYGYVLQDNKLHFCLGDVSGKGVPASLFMSQSARLFRTLATEGLSPIDIATRMNNELAENNERGMFVTMFIGLLHLDTGRLDFCNCGHNPPVLDGQFMTFEHDNAPLGLWEDDPFFGETIHDIRGRQLLIYTDGLNEAENKQKQLLGNDRLIELMANAHSLTSHEVIDMLKAAVEKHRDGAEPNDDLTLMCLKLRK